MQTGIIEHILNKPYATCMKIYVEMQERIEESLVGSFQ